MRKVGYVLLVIFFSYLVSCGRTGLEPVGRGIKTESLVVDNTADVGQYNSLKIGSDGVPQVSYYDFQDGDLRYAKLNLATGRWDVSTLDSVGDVGMYSSMDLDSFNNPHIAYYDASNDQLKYIYYSSRHNAWIDPVVIFKDHGGLAASLVIDANDLAHVAFVDSVGHDLYYMSQSPDGTFSDSSRFEVDDGTLVWGTGGVIGGKSVHLGLTPKTQRPVIVYYNASFGSLMYAIYNPDDPRAIRNSYSGAGIGWVIQIVDGKLTKNRDDVGVWNSLFISGENDYHVCYYDSLHGDLKYAHFDGDRWTIEVVDYIGVVGESCSITLDHRHVPVISYYDNTNNDLKIAYRGYGRWTTFRVDTAGIVGTFSSIATFPHSRVGVAYHDWTMKALKFMVIFAF